MRKILFEETKDDVKLMIRNLGCKKRKAWICMVRRRTGGAGAGYFCHDRR